MKTEKIKKNRKKTPYHIVTSADIAHSVHHKALSNFLVDSMCLDTYTTTADPSKSGRT